MADPQVNPNALGAPAEGFGQQVTFAFNPAGETPQMRPVNSSGPREGVSGGIQGAQAFDTRAGSAPIVEDPTAALLMKAGGEMLNKKIDEARTAEYMKGMQQSMAGVGIEEVKAQTPWYSKLFGDTPAIEGARAYQAQDTVNKTVSQQAASMTTLATLDPDQAGKHFTKVMQGAMTGDAGTDQLIMKQMSEAMPGLMKAQAKANYGYTQDRAAKTMSQSIASGADALQSFGEAYAADHVSEEDMAVRKKQFVMSALPPAGIDEEHYKKNLTSTILGMAVKGQFHAVEALKESGVFGALDNEQVTRIESTVNSQAAKARDNYSFQFADTLAEIKSDAYHPANGQTPRDLGARIDKANAAFKKLTGSPIGLFTSDQKADMLAGTFNAHKAQEEKMAGYARTLAEKTATVNDKAAAKVAQVEGIRSLVATGDITLATTVAGVTKEDVDVEVMKMSKSDPAAAMKFLPMAWNKNQGYVNKFIANELQTPLNQAYAAQGENPNAPPNDQWFQAVINYRALIKQGGLSYANDYYGEHAKALSFASSQLGDNVMDNPRAADIFRGSGNVKKYKGQDLTAKDAEGVLTRVTSEGRSFLNKATLGFSGTALRPDAARFIANDVVESANQWRASGLNDEESVQAAIQESMGKGAKGAKAEIIGGFYVKRTPGSSEARISDLMKGGNGRPVIAMPDDEVGPIFNEFMTDKLKLPKEMGTTQIYRLPDAAGTPQFIISGSLPEGGVFNAQFNAGELQDFSAERLKWRRRGSAGTRAIADDEYAAFNADQKRREATPYEPLYSFDGKPAGVGTYFGRMPRKGEQTPSIYMDAEKRAAFRAEQDRKFKK